jgi:hypothetical protein
MNCMILKGLKPRIVTQEGEDIHACLCTRARKWATEVPSVLWSLQTTPNTWNFTPFFMVYGSEIVLPSELQYGSLRVQAYQTVEVEQAWKDVIDLLQESRDITVARSARNQRTLRRYHARRVHPRAFQVGDLVLR